MELSVLSEAYIIDPYFAIHFVNRNFSLIWGLFQAPYHLDLHAMASENNVSTQNASLPPLLTLRQSANDT